MEYVWLIILAVLGAAFIAGGIVGYRKGETGKVKAISAAVIAAGVIMWAIILFVTPVSTGTG